MDHSTSRFGPQRLTLLFFLFSIMRESNAQALSPQSPVASPLSHGMTLPQTLAGGLSVDDNATELNTFNLYIDCIGSVIKSECTPNGNHYACKSKKDRRQNVTLSLAIRKDRKQAIVESSNGTLDPGTRVQILETARTYILTLRIGTDINLSLGINRQSGRLNGRERSGAVFEEGQVIADYEMTCAEVKDTDLPKPKL